MKLFILKSRAVTACFVASFHLLTFFISLQTAHGQRGLSRQEADALAAKQVDAVLQKSKPAAQATWSEHVLHFEHYEVPIYYKVFGDKPADGHSLYISLHGGGNAAPETNDQQWENQKRLYQPAEGVYLVPRAPTNTWNLWHEDHMDNIYDSLIRYAELMEGVNPDKVYIMGYSAGGDGVFQIAPRLADRWAAAAMMAGHPGDAQILNLRNLPFALFMGGKDAAYKRNEHAATWKKKLDSLHQQSPEAFVHDVHIYPEYGHWMEHRDTIAVPWMAQFTRNHAPKEVIWVQDDRLQPRFYWLSAPVAQAHAGATAHVAVQGNTITILQNDYKTLTLYLNDELVNLDKKITVIQNGKKIYHQRFTRSADTIAETANLYKDPKQVYSVKITVP